MVLSKEMANRSIKERVVPFDQRKSRGVVPSGEAWTPRLTLCRVASVRRLSALRVESGIYEKGSRLLNFSSLSPLSLSSSLCEVLQRNPWNRKMSTWS